MGLAGIDLLIGAQALDLADGLALEGLLSLGSGHDFAPDEMG
jgi:hypothetical protein